MSVTKKSQQITQRQSGLASILVTMIIMIVISLIVLAAAQLARRGQRQTLDRQLSTQAFYAAETGVNDAVNAIRTQLEATTKDDDPASLADTDQMGGCNDFIASTSSATPAVTPLNPDLGGGIKYTCLLVDPTPTTWEGTVDDTSRTTPIRNKATTVSVGAVTIAWQAKDANETDRLLTGCTATDFEPETSRACKTPILRFDLVTTDSAKRSALNASVMTGFLLPIIDGPATPPIDFTPTPNGGVKYNVSCSSTAATTPKYCKVTIKGLVLTTAGHYLRIKSFYGAAGVTVSASVGDAEDPKIELKDSQIVVDSTGKASDVLRRIQVRVPFKSATNIPEFAIQSNEGICKQLTVTGGSGNPGICGF